MSEESEENGPRATGPHRLDYTWKRKPLRKNPGPSSWQRNWYDGSTREYKKSFYQDHNEELAVHYMNKRYVSQVIGTQNEDTRVDENDTTAVRDNKKHLEKLQKAKPDMTIYYYKWSIADDQGMDTGDFGYFVRISYHGLLEIELEDNEFHIWRVGDEATGWWERLDYADVGGFSEPGTDEEADIVVHFYTFNDTPADHAGQRNRFFRADPQIDVYKAYSLRTAREASRLYADLRLSGPKSSSDSIQGDSSRTKQEEEGRELLVHLPPNESEKKRMSHWADIKQMTVFHPPAQGQRRITNRTHCCEAIVDWDISSMHHMNWEKRLISPLGGRSELRWDEGQHRDWPRMRLESTSDSQQQKTEFWVEFEENREEERRLWVYSTKLRKWYTVESRRKVQIVHHVRAEMTVRKNMKYPPDQRWDAVESGFDGVC